MQIYVYLYILFLSACRLCVAQLLTLQINLL